MRHYKGKKILILTPLIELGEKAQHIHKNLGTLAGSICDSILLTNTNYNSSFRQGQADISSGSNKARNVTPKIAAGIIKEIKTPNSIVVFEGKEAGKAFELLKKNYV